MTEEESFVILGSSQPNSLISMQRQTNEELQTGNGGLMTPTGMQQPLLNYAKFNSITKGIASATKVEGTSLSSEQSTSVDVWNKSAVLIDKENDDFMNLERSIERDVWKRSSISNNTDNMQQNSLDVKDNKSTDSLPKETSNAIGTKNENSTKINTENLAVSFLLGQVKANTLKASIHSQFPSVSPQDCGDLTTVMCDYLKMKDLIIQINNKMSSWVDKKNTMHSFEQETRKKLEQCQEQIAALRNENLKLKHELDGKVEQLTALDTVRKTEQAELVKNISERSAVIENMRAQIEQLELNQLASFEVIPKNGSDKKSDEYINRLEHERIVKNFERTMSQHLAENLEISEMQKQYIDEINCLKVNLNASENLIKQLQSDISLLKSNDIEKVAQFELYVTQRDQMREEIDILRQQVEVYSRDFQIERNAREEMAGERAQLLDDLRALQRINQKLTEQVASHEERLSTIPSSSTGAIRETLPTTPTALPKNVHVCPICEKACSSLSTLQDHVNQCLDKNVHT